MKKYFALTAMLLSITAFGQCVKCRSFEEAAKDPTTVKSIRINANQDETLEKVPVNIKQFTNLEELYLTDHGLKSVPKEIGSLSKLKSLSLAGNALEKLPEEIFTLTGLKELILFDNAFSDKYAAELRKKVKEKLPNTKLMMD